MKTLWLQGLCSLPNEEMLCKLEEINVQVHTLDSDYNSRPDSFDFFIDYCQEHKIEFLIGSSFGGFLSFWLSEELGIPCLLLNPAVSLRGKEKTKPKISRLIAPLCLVALGSEDSEVDYRRTIQFMEEDKRPDKRIKTKVWEGEKHEFSVSAFQEILDWALPEFRKYYQ